MTSNPSFPSNNTSQSGSNPNQQSYSNQSTLLNLMKKLSSSKPSSESEHPGSSIISFRDSAAPSSPSDSKSKAPTDNLILDGFLKNNGGYLDDSDSTDPEEAEDYRPSELDHNKHTIRVLAKKYQHETDSNNLNLYPLIGLNLKKLFRFNHHHPDHHHQNVSTIISKQLDNKKVANNNRAGNRHFSRTTSLDTNHQNYHLNRKDQPDNHQRTQVDNDEPIQFVRNKNYHFKFNPSSNQPSKSHRHRDNNDHLTQDEDWNLNLRYIQSSTFPTKYSIMDPHLQQDCHQRQSLKFTTNDDSYVKKYKSPFRNLVLGQDDLLRPN